MALYVLTKKLKISNYTSFNQVKYNLVGLVICYLVQMTYSVYNKIKAMIRLSIVNGIAG